MKVSFVIPAFNNWDLTHQLLWDIYKKCGSSNLHEVILVDDASNEDTFSKGLEWWKSAKLQNLEVIRNEKNLGFLLTANKGLQQATGDIIILISTDVRIYSNVVKMIKERLNSFPKTLISGKVYTTTTGWNEIDGKIYPYAEGFLLAATNEGWKELGYFDPIYAPSDFEDVDISTMAINRGYELWQLPEGAVVHRGAQTIGYSLEREKITTKNKERFIKKWIK